MYEIKVLHGDAPHKEVDGPQPIRMVRVGMMLLGGEASKMDEALGTLLRDGRVKYAGEGDLTLHVREMS